MPTAFALARRMGASLSIAYAIHAAIVVPAVLVTAILWARRVRIEVRSAALIVTTLLAQPYLVYYDLAWLILPIIFLCVDGRTQGALTHVECLMLGLVWLLPIPSFLAVFKPSIGQWGAVLLPMLLIIALRRALPYRSFNPGL
jgi:hypothetical protein